MLTSTSLTPVPSTVFPGKKNPPVKLRTSTSFPAESPFTAMVSTLPVPAVRFGAGEQVTAPLRRSDATETLGPAVCFRVTVSPAAMVTVMVGSATAHVVAACATSCRMLSKPTSDIKAKMTTTRRPHVRIDPVPVTPIAVMLSPLSSTRRTSRLSPSDAGQACHPEPLAGRNRHRAPPSPPYCFTSMPPLPRSGRHKFAISFRQFKRAISVPSS